MATAWSNIIADWQGVDNEPTAGSNNLVKSGGVLMYGLLEESNLVTSSMTRLSGYYNQDGDLVENPLFEAIEEFIPIEPSSTYVYRGGMFSALKLPIYDAAKARISYIEGSNDAENKTLLKTFKTPKEAAYIKLSTALTSETLPLGLFFLRGPLSAIDDLKVSEMTGKSFVNSSYLIEHGEGFYNTDDDNNLVFNESPLYEYYRFKNLPKTLFKAWSSLGFSVLSSVCINTAVNKAIVNKNQSNNTLFFFAAYDEFIIQVRAGSEFVLEPISTVSEKSDLLGGYSNILNGTSINNGYYFINPDDNTINESAFRLDFVKAKVHLTSGKTYILSGSTAGTAVCALTFTDSTTVLKTIKLKAGEPYVVPTGIYDLDLYFCSVFHTIDLGEAAPIGVYEVLEPLTYNSLFYFRSNADNFLLGWYDVNTLVFDGRQNENDKLAQYCHSIPIAVSKGQKFRYHGAGYKALAAVLSCNSDGVPDGILKISTGSTLHHTYVDIDFTIPEGVTYILIQSMICVSKYKENNNYYVNEAYLLYLGIDDLRISQDVQWTIPRKIYAIKGQEKSIYFDNIVNRNEDAPGYVIEVDKSFGDVDSRRFYFTPTIAETKTVTFNAWDFNNVLLSTKTVTIEVIDSVLSTQKRVVCIGDSITEGRGEGDTNTNMPYYIKKGLDKALTSGSENAIFVGSKGSPVKHEGWWGRHYQWLANIAKDSSQPSPLVNPDTDELDIHYYRTKVCGLAEEEYIDVVSLAMGFNNTKTQNDAEVAFSSMQSIIAAFKEDNPNTKFIVHLVTYPAMGNVKQPNKEQKIDMKNSLYYFRQLCMNAYNDGQDNNIFIGDLGLGYDRWYAYIRETVHPAPYYDEDTIQVITDRAHPSYRGAKQMGENTMHSILKAMQMA